MSRKRLASEMDAAAPARPRRQNTKRKKTSPSDDERSDSSIPSLGSVSVASALESSPPTSHRRQSSMSSLQSTSHDDSESSLSSSSEESSDADGESDDESIVTLGGPRKPAMGETKGSLLSGAHELSARISALLPQLAAANNELDAEGASHNMEEVDDGEQHVEMNLGLGVLEQKVEGDGSSSDESSEDDSGDSEVDEVPVSSGAVKREDIDTDTHVMEKLMGQKSLRQKAGVQPLD